MYFPEPAIDTNAEEQQSDGNTIEEALVHLSERVFSDKKDGQKPANDESVDD